MEVRRELQLECPTGAERDGPVMLLGQVVLESVLVVLQQGHRPPLGHDNNIAPHECVRQIRQCRRDVGIGVVNDEIFD
ncbi:MAG TPA: hypothetical protein DDY88_05865 [Actinobacteria bacterium]|nr:hypothetical protein [Actinomycetota bacterium]